ncbi:glycerate kinase [Psychromonas hadalis]|uniref:glycerate kinase n=1 Tax=Psychromonas hadalis TaxID=211669 RepID=UPI0003B77A48|nr:glycerate kinase [Psychromonas hadalis]
MKIIIAPDSYKESLTAMQVANAIETGFKKMLPDAQYIKLPMSDGGEGTVQSLIDASNGHIETCFVRAPLGEQIEAFYGLMGNKKTAIIEMAAASGLHLVKPELRNPLLTTSYGTGELIKAVLDKGFNHIIIGIGGSATNDAGIGMAQALGVKMLDKKGQEIGFGGGAIADLVTIDTSNMDSRLAKVKLEIACDVDNPLCGEKGASAVFGPQKGATIKMVTELDDNLAHYAELLKTQFGKDIKNSAGAGAAGGMGATLLALFNASLRPGIDIVMDAVNLDKILSDADLVITGEGRIDSQTIHGKTPVGVARAAKKYNLPVIGIAGCLSDDCEVVYEHGINSVFSTIPAAMSLDNAMKNAAFNIEKTACNIAALLKIQLR